MVGYHQILCNKNHKIVNMVGWPTLVKYVIFMIFVQAYLNDAYHLSTPPPDLMVNPVQMRGTILWRK